MIINLVQNACQARIGDRNEVIVATRYDEPNNEVIVSVKDFGAGIEKRVLSNTWKQRRAKESFATTCISVEHSSDSYPAAPEKETGYSPVGGCISGKCRQDTEQEETRRSPGAVYAAGILFLSG